MNNVTLHNKKVLKGLTPLESKGWQAFVKVQENVMLEYNILGENRFCYTYTAHCGRTSYLVSI
jgi:hypothetical protein